jgi:tRNA (guanine-N7-)-methyltransferase
MTIDPKDAAAPAQTERRNFYGRVHGKTLRASQKTYLAEDLGKVRLAGVTVEENPSRAMLDVAGLFDGRPLWLEVGFGGGSIWFTWLRDTLRWGSSAANPS